MTEAEKKDANPRTQHYDFTYRGVRLDPYRIMKVYRITDPAQQHAIKKLLRAGRSVKPLIQDVGEVILTLQRWREMIIEDGFDDLRKGKP